MIEQFSLDRVNKAAASFDPKKLDAFQEHYMGELSRETVLEMAMPYLERAGFVGPPPAAGETERAGAVVEAAADRIKVVGDILEYDEFFVGDDEFVYDEKAFEKRLTAPEEAAELLAGFRDVLAGTEAFDAANLEAALRGYVEERGVKLGQVIHALRVAVTGKAVGFGMFEILEVLGRESCVARIDRALQLAH